VILETVQDGLHQQDVTGINQAKMPTKGKLMWFEQLTGFTEQGAAQVRQMMSLENGVLASHANGAKFKIGHFVTPSLAELITDSKAIKQSSAFDAKPIKVQEVIADVQSLHTDPQNAGALFQVASQFNLLEMVGPTVTPDSGITGYQFDRTQGPACAMACGAGLIYRNYFVPVNGDVGQTAERQLNMLDAFEQQLLVQVNKHNEQQFDSLWQMKNGYALPGTQQLAAINNALEQLSQSEINALISTIKIGVQYDTQVTVKNTSHLVTQAYCSAMPVAYSQHSSAQWQPLASLILQAAYQGTLAAAVINAEKTGNNRVYLTLLGGGAFGNAIEWIMKALQQALYS
jgi:lipoprotein signal peptidase